MKFKRDHENTSIDLIEKLGIELQEKTRAAAAPRKPKNGAVSSPLNGAIITETTSDGSDQRTEIFRFPQRERERERGSTLRSLLPYSVEGKEPFPLFYTVVS